MWPGGILVDPVRAFRPSGADADGFRKGGTRCEVGGYLTLALLSVAALALGLTQAGVGNATAEHRDLLINRMKTQAPNGDVVTLWGSGVWNTATNAVEGVRGAFVHRTADGELVARGFWRATGVNSFTSYGTDPADPALEGGELVLDVVFNPDKRREPSVTFQDFTVVCLVGTPPEGAEEEVTFGPFQMPVHGEHQFTLFIQF